jgi:hypothetical protein
VKCSHRGQEEVQKNYHYEKYGHEKEAAKNRDHNPYHFQRFLSGGQRVSAVLAKRRGTRIKPCASLAKNLAHTSSPNSRTFL